MSTATVVPFVRPATPPRPEETPASMPTMAIDYRLFRPVPVEARFAVRGLTVLLGVSGEGKTSLLEAIAGLLPADGTPFRGQPPQRRPIGYLPQGFALFPHLRAWENVAYPLPRGRDRRDHASALLARVGMAAFAERFPSALSGGQQQRVALGRAMVTSPRVMLMDEPLSNIDPPNRLKMRQEILAFHKENRLTTLYVTHNLADGIALADRIAVMHEGRFEQADTPEQLMRNPINEYVADFFKAEQFSHRISAP